MADGKLVRMGVRVEGGLEAVMNMGIGPGKLSEEFKIHRDLSWDITVISTPAFSAPLGQGSCKQ